MAVEPTAETGRADAIIVVTALALSLVGLVALALVVIVGVSGGTPSGALTWIGMITIPVAFLLLLVEFSRAIARRRRA